MKKPNKTNTKTYEPPVREIITFWEFFSEIFIPLQGIKIPLCSIHKETCDILEKAFLGELNKRFIIINMPPRIGKTLIVNAFVAWGFWINSKSHWIYTSYSQPLAEKSSRFIQDTINSDWYLSICGTELGRIRKADEFNTSGADGIGVFKASGVGGTITGYGAGLKEVASGCAILDDPANPNEALSRAETDKLLFWLENTLTNRLNSDKSFILIVQQRLNTDDLSGHVLATYPDECYHIKFPAVLQDGKGEEYCAIEATRSLKSLQTLREKQPFTYWSQYQQEPVVIGGNLIPVDSINRYKEDMTNYKFDSKIITVDTAVKTKEHNDYSVLQCWGKIGTKAYLIDSARGKWESPMLLQNLVTFYNKHNQKNTPVSHTYVEDITFGTTLRQEALLLGVPIEAMVRNNSDKVVRVEQILSYVATGMVSIPAEAPWLSDLINELMAFRKDGKAKHDDQVDCFADAIYMLLGRPVTIFDAISNRMSHRFRR